MRRRDLFLAAVMLAPLLRSARAQKPVLTKRLSWVVPTGKPADMNIGGDATNALFLEELRRLGFIEGQNLIVDRYSAEGRRERYGEIASEVVATRPDAIWSIGTPLTLELKAATNAFQLLPSRETPFVLGSSLAWPILGAISPVSVPMLDLKFGASVWRCLWKLFLRLRALFLSRR